MTSRGDAPESTPPNRRPRTDAPELSSLEATFSPQRVSMLGESRQNNEQSRDQLCYKSKSPSI